MALRNIIIFSLVQFLDWKRIRHPVYLSWCWVTSKWKILPAVGFNFVVDLNRRTELSNVANEKWTSFTKNDRERMSRMAAASAWGLSQWDAMDRYVNYIPLDTTDGAFYRAVLSVHRDQFTVAGKVSKTPYRLGIFEIMLVRNRN